MNIKSTSEALLDPTSIQKSRTKIIKFVCHFTSVVAFGYALYFWLVIDQFMLGATNMLFVLAYALPHLLIKFKYIRLASYWFFAVLMAHVYLLTAFIFSADTGFHFYYLLVPSGVFLLLDEKDYLAKVLITVMGTGLFFTAEHAGNAPLIVLSAQAETIIFSSTIIVTIVELGIVMFIFSHMISTRERKLKEMASIDPLTQVNNRRNFMQKADSLIAYSLRKKEHYSLVIMDIDHFKRINDTHGHVNGDIALAHVANVIKQSVRKSDVLARYGGEEFIVLFPDTKIQEAIKIAELIREAVASKYIKLNQELELSCTLSLGVAEGNENNPNLSEVINQADKALYKAKDNGRNCVCF